MSTWIITTGNTDVQLTTNENWNRGDKLYSKHNNDEPLDICDEFNDITYDEQTESYPVPSRVLGLVYKDHEEHYQDLRFPLLDTFCQKFNDDKKPEKVIILLTDQSTIFDEENSENPECPYWQDTCELENIFYWYFEQKLKIQPEFITLKPDEKGKRGIDNWEEMLNVVRKKLLEKLLELDIDTDELVYVSHQASTPAISSAIQFISIGLFSNVQFLISNQYYEDEEKKAYAELINSSNYWRDLQIQKAKKLIIDGFPGAALELMKEIEQKQKEEKEIITQETKEKLEKLVRKFNIKALDNEDDNYVPETAIKRIYDALELIEIFFEKQNYLQGITLLTASQEAFLKSAVLTKIKNKTVTLRINGQNKNYQGGDLIKWTNRGLFFIEPDKCKPWERDNELKTIFETDNDNLIKQLKENTLQQLNFPISEIQRNDSLDFNRINNNNVLLEWLFNLEKDFKNKCWQLLRWICIKKDQKKQHEDDLRNQLMHNLVGVKEEDVKKFLMGNTQQNTKKTVMEIYQTNVKRMFIQALYDFNLTDDNNPDNKLKQELKDFANELN